TTKRPRRLLTSCGPVVNFPFDIKVLCDFHLSLCEHSPKIGSSLKRISAASGYTTHVPSRRAVMGPHAPSAVTTCHHRSRHVVTIYRWGLGRRLPQRALPAAQAVMRRTVAGGHQTGVSIGTEPALCQSSISAV